MKKVGLHRPLTSDTQLQSCEGGVDEDVAEKPCHHAPVAIASNGHCASVMLCHAPIAIASNGHCASVMLCDCVCRLPLYAAIASNGHCALL